MDSIDSMIGCLIVAAVGICCAALVLKLAIVVFTWAVR